MFSLKTNSNIWILYSTDSIDIAYILYHSTIKYWHAIRTRGGSIFHYIYTVLLILCMSLTLCFLIKEVSSMFQSYILSCFPGVCTYEISCSFPAYACIVWFVYLMCYCSYFIIEVLHCSWHISFHPHLHCFFWVYTLFVCVNIIVSYSYAVICSTRLMWHVFDITIFQTILYLYTLFFESIWLSPYYPCTILHVVLSQSWNLKYVFCFFFLNT